jgi:hypothetical protein
MLVLGLNDTDIASDELEFGNEVVEGSFGTPSIMLPTQLASHLFSKHT